MRDFTELSAWYKKKRINAIKGKKCVLSAKIKVTAEAETKYGSSYYTDKLIGYAEDLASLNVKLKILNKDEL